MLNALLTSFSEELKETFSEFSSCLKVDLNFSEIERRLSECLNQFCSSILELLLKDLLKDSMFIAALKEMCGKLGMRLKEYREIGIRLYNGHELKILSPYFVEKQSKKKPGRPGQKKRGPSGGRHMALEALGFIRRCSPNFASEAVKLAVLCPSFEVTEQIFSDRGIRLDKKVIRQLCCHLGRKGLADRGSICLEQGEQLDGESLLIGIDGGRLRLRKKKVGRKKKGNKRHGYHTDWKEPKLFTLYQLDAMGKKIKEWPPIYDATMGNHEEAFRLISSYLDQLDLSGVRRMIVCGDGAEWIWKNADVLKKKFSKIFGEIIEVVDYTHAKQNLQDIIDLLPNQIKKHKKRVNQYKKRLFAGDIKGIYQLIEADFSSANKQEALKKWCNYFYKNKDRMRYQYFKDSAIPCGSGCVESAIRRVVNMRLKSAGTFWIRENAEYFLFLRSQLLSGRWNIFVENVRKKALTAIEKHVIGRAELMLPTAA